MNAYSTPAAQWSRHSCLQFNKNPPSLRIPPVFTNSDIRDQGHFELIHLLHFVLYHRGKSLGLVGRSFEYEFVMHLQQHGGLVFLIAQPAVNMNHGKLDEIRGSALER